MNRYLQVHTGTVSRFCVTAATTFGLWWLLTQGVALFFGALLAVLLALLATWLLPDAGKLPRPLAIPGFVLVFVWRSLSGAVDVAWRALHREMPLQPHWREYRLILQEPAARAMFIGTISLMPGTLGADIEGDVVRVHGILEDLEQELQLMERQIAALFNEPGTGR